MHKYVSQLPQSLKQEDANNFLKRHLGRHNNNYYAFYHNTFGCLLAAL